MQDFFSYDENREVGGESDDERTLHEILEENLHQIRIAGVALQFINEYYRKYIIKEPCMTSQQTGDKWVRELLSGHDG